MAVTSVRRCRGECGVWTQIGPTSALQITTIARGCYSTRALRDTTLSCARALQWRETHPPNRRVIQGVRMSLTLPVRGSVRSRISACSISICCKMSATLSMWRTSPICGRHNSPAVVRQRGKAHFSDPEENSTLRPIGVTPHTPMLVHRLDGQERVTPGCADSACHVRLSAARVHRRRGHAHTPLHNCGRPGPG